MADAHERRRGSWLRHDQWRCDWRQYRHRAKPVGRSGQAAMKIRRRNSQGGIAIVIVLVCIFALSALTAIFCAYMRVEVRLAANSNNEADMQWLGRSGVEMARYVLGQQMMIPNEPYDSLNQKWAGGDCETNDLLSDVSLTDV